MLKRYYLSLDQEAVEEFQKHCTQFGLQRGQLSASCNDTIREMNTMFRRCQENGKFTVKDLFAMIGENIIKSIEEEGKNEKSSQKAKTLARQITKR